MGYISTLLLLLSAFPEFTTGRFEQQYIGCYRDNPTRAMETRVDDYSYRQSMTLEVCRGLCTSYTYFGVQNSGECFCDHKYIRYGQSNECSYSCNGNRSQRCGGRWAISVYSVCPFGFYGPSCTDRCYYCKNTTQHAERCIMNGTCPGGCQAGWTGLTCETDIDECSGSTSATSCQQICTNTPGSYKCSCYEGYTLNANERSCNDVDECVVANGGCQQKCINTPGHFNCSCYTEYHTLNIDGRTCSDGSVDNSATVAAGVILAVLLAGGLVAILVLIRWRRRQLVDGMTKTFHAQCDRDNLSVDSVESVVISCPTNCQQLGRGNSTENSYLESPLSGTSAGLLADDQNPIYSNFKTGIKDASKTCVLVSDLPTLVQRIQDMPEYLQAEFAALAVNSDAKSDFAQKPELKSKNRFKNILPYDSNRVVLSTVNNNPLTTYINASFIKGYEKHEKLIASHGPTNNTINDFWRMIWEYNVGVVVMVTNCIENGKTKCEKYWTDSLPKKYGDIKTRPDSIDERPDRIVRELTISKDGEAPRLLTQIQFTDWPDHGVLEHAVSVLAIRHAVKRIVGRDQYIVVHCSAGVGRTGTYLAIDFLLSQAMKEGFVDVCSYAKQLRAQRMHCVQTLDQYSFIFKALHEGLILGETTRSVTDFKQLVTRRHQTNPITKKSIMDTEFQMLHEMQPLPQDSDCSEALKEANKAKNRDPRILPMDNRRVYIKERAKGRTDYINAVFVPGFLRKNAYIATQLPLRKTAGDFWNMFVDYDCRIIVCLCTVESQDLNCFLPPVGERLKFGKTFVCDARQLEKASHGISTTSVAVGRAGTMSLINRSLGRRDENIYANIQDEPAKTATDDASCRVTVVKVVVPADRAAVIGSLLTVRRLVVDVLGKVEPTDGAEPPVVVVSRDGVVHCGQFISVCNLCDMINTQQEVDVFQTVYNIRRAQPHFFTNMLDYEEMYTNIESCIQEIATNVYNNT